MSTRQRATRLDITEAQPANGLPAVARRRRPRRSAAELETSDAVARVLDIQKVPLTRLNPQRVSLLISLEPGARLALGLIGRLVGLRACDDGSGLSFTEQIIELKESGVFGRGQRKWFACPGRGESCGSRRMKLYLPPGERTFACAECHGLEVPHSPGRPLRWQGVNLRQQTLHWQEPAELRTQRSA